jgi:antitoxin component YwqK of YwqJK toxin-antitoxin module/tetratricopeptide (TPR) repeat protein
MKKIMQFAGCLIILFSLSLKAQNKNQHPVLRSSEILERIIELSEMESYGEAAAVIDGLFTGDSLYDDLMTEKVYLLYQDSSYEESLKLAQELMQRPGENVARLHLLSVLALRGLERYDDAINMANAGIEKYPYHNLLYFQRGITHKEKKDYAAAFEDFKKSVYYNPFGVEAHIQLGLISAQSNRWTETALALTTALALRPNASNAIPILQFLENVLTGELEPDIEPFKYQDMDNFEDVELVLHNKVSLNKNYKLKSKVDFRVLRQIQVMMESVSALNPEDAGFFGKYYIPFYRNIFESNQTELFFYYLLSNLDHPVVNAQQKSKKKKLTAFVDWAGGKLSEMNSRRFPLDANEPQYQFIFHSGGGFNGKGFAKKDDTPYGDWIYFFANGERQSTGSFDEEGNRTGDWHFYDDHGRLRDHSIYRTGKLQDTCTIWAPNGYIERKLYYIDDEIQLVLNYYPSGIIMNEMEIKNGKRHGQFKRFHPNGELHQEGNYVDGEIDGVVKFYFDNGQFETLSNYEKGKQTGVYLDYYRDSIPHIEGNFENGKETGSWTFYFRNGKVQRTGTFVNGKESGLWKSYHPSGNLLSEINFQDGKQHGVSTTYDIDGRPWYQEISDKGKITGFIQFDKEGNPGPEQKAKKGTISVKVKNHDGVVVIEGDFVNGQKSGQWKYYNAIGVLETISTYEDDEQNGDHINYYLDGQVRSRVNYQNNNMDGLYNEFSPYGQVIESGYYEAGQRKESWFEFYRDGTVKARRFLRDGNFWGDIFLYSPDGKITQQLFYPYGEFTGKARFDTTGASLDTIKLINGQVTFASKGPSGVVDYTGTYLYGSRHGKVTYRNARGLVISEGDFWMGYKHGKWTYYDLDGKLERIEHYHYGNLHGPIVSYYSDGTKDYEKTFVFGQQDGSEIQYHLNGKIASEANYLNGNLHGEVKFYSPDGALAIVRLYRNGDWVAYSYSGTDGKLIPFIYLKPGEMVIEAFFANGRPSVKASLNNGIFHGTFQSFFANGQPYFDGRYERGFLQGSTTHYNENGSVREKDQYIDGLEDGIHEAFHPNGKVKLRSTYRMGVLHGLYERFDTNGKLKDAYLYYNDDLEFIVK